MLIKPSPVGAPIDVTNGIIPADSPLRGAAACIRRVTEDDLSELQGLMDGVDRYNLIYPPDGAPNVHRIVYRTPGLNVTSAVYRIVRERPERVFREGFRRWELLPGREHLWQGNSTFFNLHRYVHERGPPGTPPNFISVFVSTTISRQWCPSPPLDGGTVFRYEIYAPGGIHVRATLCGCYRYRAQDEVAFLEGIAPEFIRSAQEFRITVGPNGRRHLTRVNDALLINPFFNPQPYLDELPNYNRLRSPILYYYEGNQRRRLRISVLVLPTLPSQPRSKRHTELMDPRHPLVPTPRDLLDYYTTGVAETKNYLDAAFRSCRENEAYLFVEKEYVLVDYAPGSTDDRVVNGPHFIFEGFVSLGETDFAEVRIDCAFGVEGKEEAFIFCGALCAKINYAPGTTNDWIIEGPMSIADMFPFFENSGYARGLDAAFELSSTEAYIFRGKYCARINFVEKRLIEVRLITDAFPCLKDTMLASDIGAAFRSHRDNEAYLFKGPHYALLKYSGETSLAGGIVKGIEHNWPSLKGFLPRENFGLDYYPHPNPPPDRPHDQL